ncbi:MAG TPA: GDSL-type esterase/lipase family protein [Streptosporangiaceae bacterium]|nr:GDSL-type esterase/lipase family protein [Streptosporangiaceae bacterium]
MTRPQQGTAGAPPPPAPPHPDGAAGRPGAEARPGRDHYRTLLGAARQRADRAERAKRRRRTVTRRLIWLAVVLLTAAIAIAVALRTTPQQTVTVAGQVIKVGTTAPSLSVSGPGEVDLFGQSLPTQVQFLGPVRPSLTLTQITINSQLTNFVQGAGPAGAERILGNALASGWMHYFGWEIAITAAGVLLLLGALAGWRRLPHRTTVKLLAGGLVAAEAINLGAIMLTAYTAPGTLRQVRSLSQLVGSEPQYPDSKKTVPVPPGVRVVVMGDSTAAGAGLPWVRDASRTDQMCGRSADSYAEDLARSNGWQVMNLACNSATIGQGLLGPEGRGGELVPAQIGIAEQATRAQAVIVSVGADDLGWAAMLRLCAVARACNDKATTAYFQQQLATLSKDYFQLLSQLADLPSHPQVIINRYYDPFDLQLNCLSKVGLTTTKLRTLNSRLSTLNAVLAKGAAEFGFTSVKPDFTGHQLCTPQPYVQGLGDPAPFHPTAEGQLAIALADQAALSPVIMPSSAAVQTPSPAATPPR